MGLGDLDAREACDFEEVDVDVSGEGAGDAAGPWLMSALVVSSASMKSDSSSRGCCRG
jgi:hypothetical protein